MQKHSRPIAPPFRFSPPLTKCSQDAHKTRRMETTHWPSALSLSLREVETCDKRLHSPRRASRQRRNSKTAARPVLSARAHFALSARPGRLGCRCGGAPRSKAAWNCGMAQTAWPRLRPHAASCARCRRRFTASGTVMRRWLSPSWRRRRGRGCGHLLQAARAAGGRCPRAAAPSRTAGSS